MLMGYFFDGCFFIQEKWIAVMVQSEEFEAFFADCSVYLDPVPFAKAGIMAVDVPDEGRACRFPLPVTLLKPVADFGKERFYLDDFASQFK